MTSDTNIYIYCSIFVWSNLPQIVRESYDSMSLLSNILGTKEKDRFLPREKSIDGITPIGLDGEWSSLGSPFQRW